MSTPGRPVDSRGRTEPGGADRRGGGVPTRPNAAAARAAGLGGRALAIANLGRPAPSRPAPPRATSRPPRFKG